MAQLKEFEVTYRNKSGDKTTKKTTSQGYSDREVRSSFDKCSYQVISVVYKKMIF